MRYDVDPILYRAVGNASYVETERNWIGHLETEVRLLFHKERDEALVLVCGPKRHEVHSCTSRDEGRDRFADRFIELHEQK